MATYSFNTTAIQEKALDYFCAKTRKTRAQLFQDFVVDGLLAGWVKEWIDADFNSIKNKWDSLTETQKNQIKIIVGV